MMYSNNKTRNNKAKAEMESESGVFDAGKFDVSSDK